MATCAGSKYLSSPVLIAAMTPVGFKNGLRRLARSGEMSSTSRPMRRPRSKSVLITSASCGQRAIFRLPECIDKYGPGSEKLSDAQLELLDLEPGVSSAEVQAESDRGQLKLPLEKRACKDCEEQGVQSASLPPRIIEKGLASDRVVIDTVVSKYADHQPLYRQSAILERETGIELSRATLDGWVMRVGELLRPISAAMGQELLSGSYIQADETTVGVQMHDGRGKNHQAYLWEYSHPAGPVVFDFRLGREREGPKRFLGNFEGLLQSDGYGAYDHIGGPGLVHAACWAHARRKFFDAVKLNPKDTTSIQVVAQMDELFGIDAQARQEGLNQIDRQVLRLDKSKPLLAEIKTSIQAARTGALPKSALAKACDYTLTLWSRLSRFLEYPELELSNNLAENAMRPVALGRRNWIHVGSKEAGPRVAAIISIVETCRRLRLPLRDYLSSVLPGLADFPSNRVAELTPNAWATRI
jgi:transposase